MTRDELNKMTVKQLKAYYEEISGALYGRSIKKKDQILGDIENNLRAKQRGKAFKEWV